MYHPGKIIIVYGPKDKSIESADSGTQALLEMWDENMITVSVDPHLSGKIKKDDVVLVDYTTPKLNVIKLLKSDTAKQTWKMYKERYEKKKPQQPPVQLTKIRQQPYVG
ncbi:MAG: hypothetical protein HZB67_04340 [Candidatus Aenigmarchaeota archaeon]|nr:hypothetical protein [Candidatus Aenigmarchaeota archaeon]